MSVSSMLLINIDVWSHVWNYIGFGESQSPNKLGNTYYRFFHNVTYKSYGLQLAIVSSETVSGDWRKKYIFQYLHFLIVFEKCTSPVWIIIYALILLAEISCVFPNVFKIEIRTQSRTVTPYLVYDVSAKIFLWTKLTDLHLSCFGTKAALL